MSSVRQAIKWEEFDPSSHLHKVCALMQEIGEEIRQPFAEDGLIIVRMSDSWAFLFDMQGMTLRS